MITSKFVMLYLLLLLPTIVVTLLSVLGRCKNKKTKTVRVSLIIIVIVFFCSVISLFAALANGLDYLYGLNEDLWFVIMMFVIYILTNFLLIQMFKEKIIYSTEARTIYASKLFFKKAFNAQEITRFNLSDEYLDIYIGDERIRYGNNFLVGVDEFVGFLKNRDS